MKHHYLATGQEWDNGHFAITRVKDMTNTEQERKQKQNQKTWKKTKLNNAAQEWRDSRESV